MPTRKRLWYDFRQIEAKLLVGAVGVGLMAAVIKGRFTPSGIAVSLGLTVAVALGTGVVYRWLTARRRRRRG
jgi:hypothetical protein